MRLSLWRHAYASWFHRKWGYQVPMKLQHVQMIELHTLELITQSFTSFYDFLFAWYPCSRCRHKRCYHIIFLLCDTSIL